VIATTSSAEKTKRLEELGADAVINYATNPEWHQAVRELTAARGVDQVIEISGGTLEKSIQSTAIEGLVNFIGRLDGESAVDIGVLYNSIATVRVVAAGSRAQFIAMNRAMTANRLRPVIDRVFPFEEVPAAFRYYEANRPFGKVVIGQR
jgi:NADPH:quinone reductase-like Zn-dependent oxidoreductase